MMYPTTTLAKNHNLDFLAYETDTIEIWKDSEMNAYYTYNTETGLWTDRDTGVPLIGYTDTYHQGLDG